MARIKVIHDLIGETLVVYWDDPTREEVCEEVGHEIILMKDAEGEVSGFERLYFKSEKAPQELGVILPTVNS
jgi:hypothetical protein